MSPPGCDLVLAWRQSRWRKHEAAEWLKRGYSPAAIARKMAETSPVGHTSTYTVMEYLYNQVGEGNIRRSDIVFSIERDTRELIESAITGLESTGTVAAGEMTAEDEEKVAELIYTEIRKIKTVSKAELEFYMELRDARVALGDMYEFLREIELTLHSIVKETLVSNYGLQESGWWEKGVPEKIQAQCKISRDYDEDPATDLFCYTTFIHLVKIIDGRWELFSQLLPKSLSSDRKKLFTDLQKLNRIRNAVMHPVKGLKPTEDDFALVREFRSRLKGDPEKTRTAESTSPT